MPYLHVVWTWIFNKFSKLYATAIHLTYFCYMWLWQREISTKHYILIIWVSFSSLAQYFGLPAFAKSAISRPSLTLLRAKYKRPSAEENKNPNNLKVTVVKQVSKNLLPDKFSENRFFFLSSIGIGDRCSKSLLSYLVLIVSFSSLEITLCVCTENLSISVNNSHYSPWFQRMISKYWINFHTKILWCTNICEIKFQPSCYPNYNYFSVFEHILLFITGESSNTVNLWMSAQGAYFKFRRRKGVLIWEGAYLKGVLI